MRLIFYTVMLLLGFSICFVLGLLLLRRLQPGEPLVDLTEEKHCQVLRSSWDHIKLFTVSLHTRLMMS